MKIIHCADIHLDSKISANLDEGKAKLRREEILHTFIRMVDFARENQVQVILIAGDLFDTRRVRVSVRNAVEDVIRKHEGIRFYLLKGNHEASGFLNALETIPDNLYLFGEDWTRYVLYEDPKGRIVLTGAELTEANRGLTDRLVLDYEDFNLVMLHGQQTNYAGKHTAETIPLSELKNKGIDYLALGHVHEYREEQLDKRGIWCYSGCLEGRGFDECGEHGFVLLEIDEETHSWSHQFVPFAERRLHTLRIDVTGCDRTAQMLERVQDFLAEQELSSEDMVKIVLSGKVDVDCEKDSGQILRAVADRFFFVKVYDETGLLVDYRRYVHDQSLKGEFVRKVMESDMEEEQKAVVIRYGLQALAGEEIE